MKQCSLAIREKGKIKLKCSIKSDIFGYTCPFQYYCGTTGQYENLMREAERCKNDKLEREAIK